MKKIISSILLLAILSPVVSAQDVADSVWGAYNLSPGAVVEELIIRPQLGDL